MGPYHRDLVLPQLVDGDMTNATYGNGVLVLAMPILPPGTPREKTEFQLDTITGTRGQHVSHTGGGLPVADSGARQSMQTPS
jgi:hypothetical protein